MKSHRQNDSLSAFEDQLRALTPRAPQSSFESTLSSASLPAESSFRVEQSKMVRWMTGSWACGAAIGAAVMYLMLNASFFENGDNQAESSEPLAAASATPTEEPIQAATSDTLLATTTEEETADWLEQLQLLPSGSLGVGTSLLISRNSLPQMQTQILPEQLDLGENAEQDFEEPDIKTQRELMREMLDNPFEFY
jgi:hypothetical protein